MVKIDKTNGSILDEEIFNISDDPAEVTRLSTYIDGLSSGDLIVSGIMEDASINLNPTILDKLKEIGWHSSESI